MINKQLNRFFVFLFIVVPLITSKLLAHQKKEAVTKIIFNERTENIEIIHRFLIHDAEHVAKKLFGKAADIIDDKHPQQQFAEYIIGHFTLSNLLAESLPLAIVGFEVDGRYIWIYQESPLQAGLQGLIVSQNALLEIWDTQVNLVNIERNQKVRSLIFKGSSAPQLVKF